MSSFHYVEQWHALNSAAITQQYTIASLLPGEMGRQATTLGEGDGMTGKSSAIVLGKRKSHEQVTAFIDALT